MTAHTWDVFVSHASEDRVELVAPLVDHLRRLKVRVWVDYKELSMGDSLRERLEEGLSRSRFGIVVLSKSFFAVGKKWTTRELNGLVALNLDTSSRLLPIWHDLTSREIANHSPVLANLIGIKTDRGISRVALAILSKIQLVGARGEAARDLEYLIAEYDQLLLRDNESRLREKNRIREAIRRRAYDVSEVSSWADRATEGGRLAFVTLLRRRPRREHFLQLVETCRRTTHRFVWIEACAAIRETASYCKLHDNQLAQGESELSALRTRPLYRKSRAVVRATEDSIEWIATKRRARFQIGSALRRST